MTQKKIKAAVYSQVQLAEGIFSMWLGAGEMAKAAVPGQFIAVYPNDSARLLPRPISICETDPEKELLRIVYRVAGEGTHRELLETSSLYQEMWKAHIGAKDGDAA